MSNGIAALPIRPDFGPDFRPDLWRWPNHRQHAAGFRPRGGRAMAKMSETILVSHNQICVFDASLDDPFNDWTDDHVRQDFAWRPGSVSFGAAENSETTITVEAVSVVALEPAAFRVISVPFTVPASGIIIVGSIGDEKEVEVAAGTCSLVFELARKEKKPWCRLGFVAAPHPQARIIKADAKITKPDSFIMNANPAV